MGNKALTWVRTKVRGLNPAAKLVLMMLADHKNELSGVCNPSIPLLVEETGLSESGVKNAIRELEAAGLVRRKYDPKKGRTDYFLGPEGGQPVTPCDILGGSLSDYGGGQPVTPKQKEETERKNTDVFLSLSGRKRRQTKANRRKEYSPRFLLFWQSVPMPSKYDWANPGSKMDAFEAFDSLTDEDQMDCIRGWMKFLEHFRKNREAGSKIQIPHAVSFINQRRWESYVEEGELQ